MIFCKFFCKAAKRLLQSMWNAFVWHLLAFTFRFSFWGLVGLCSKHHTATAAAGHGRSFQSTRQALLSRPTPRQSGTLTRPFFLIKFLLQIGCFRTFFSRPYTSPHGCCRRAMDSLGQYVFWHMSRPWFSASFIVERWESYCNQCETQLCDICSPSLFVFLSEDLCSKHHTATAAAGHGISFQSTRQALLSRPTPRQNGTLTRRSFLIKFLLQIGYFRTFFGRPCTTPLGCCWRPMNCLGATHQICWKLVVFLGLFVPPVLSNILFGFCCPDLFAAE